MSASMCCAVCGLAAAAGEGRFDDDVVVVLLPERTAANDGPRSSVDSDLKYSATCASVRSSETSVLDRDVKDGFKNGQTMVC